MLVQTHPDGRWIASMEYSMVPKGLPWRSPVSATRNPEPVAEPAPASEPWPLPRLFAAPIQRTVLPSGVQVLDAIADDGTCWEMYPDGSWEQIPELPQPEA